MTAIRGPGLPAPSGRTPVVVLQPAGGAFIQWGSQHVEQQADRMPGHGIDPIQLGHAVDIAGATPHASRMARKNEVEIRVRPWVITPYPERAMATGVHGRIQDLVKIPSVYSAEVPTAFRALRHLLYRIDADPIMYRCWMRGKLFFSLSDGWRPPWIQAALWTCNRPG